MTKKNNRETNNWQASRKKRKDRTRQKRHILEKSELGYQNQHAT